MVGLTEEAAARVVEDARRGADLREVKSVVTVENGVLGACSSTIVSSFGMATQIEGMQTQCRYFPVLTLRQRTCETQQKMLIL